MENRIVFVVKLVHSVIFFFVVACLGYILYCGIARRYDWTLLVALVVVCLEGLVILVNRGKCPLTGLAEKYGAASGTVTDIFLPIWFTRHVFRIAVVVVIIELVLLGVGYFT